MQIHISFSVHSNVQYRVVGGSPQTNTPSSFMQALGDRPKGTEKRTPKRESRLPLFPFYLGQDSGIGDMSIHALTLNGLGRPEQVSSL